MLVKKEYDPLINKYDLVGVIMWQLVRKKYDLLGVAMWQIVRKKYDLMSNNVVTSKKWISSTKV